MWLLVWLLSDVVVIVVVGVVGVVGAGGGGGGRRRPRMMPFLLSRLYLSLSLSPLSFFYVLYFCETDCFV